jgi:hypothetical protein
LVAGLAEGVCLLSGGRDRLAALLGKQAPRQGRNVSRILFASLRNVDKSNPRRSFDDPY